MPSSTFIADVNLRLRSLSDIDRSTAANYPRPAASFSARKNPQCIPVNTPPVFPGLRPRIWPHLFRPVTKAMSDRLLVLVHDGFEVAAADHLLIEQPLRSLEERGLSFRQQSFHTLVLLIDDTAHLAVDLAGSLLRVVAFLLRRLDLHHQGLAFTIERDGPKLV